MGSLVLGGSVAFNPTLGLILTHLNLKLCASPYSIFQSYLRSDSDIIKLYIPEIPTCTFNPTLGLILTRARVAKFYGTLSFQSYLRSDSDLARGLFQEAGADVLSILP